MRFYPKKYELLFLIWVSVSYSAILRLDITNAHIAFSPLFHLLFFLWILSSLSRVGNTLSEQQNLQAKQQKSLVFWPYSPRKWEGFSSLFLFLLFLVAIIIDAAGIDCFSMEVLLVFAVEIGDSLHRWYRASI